VVVAPSDCDRADPVGPGRSIRSATGGANRNHNRAQFRSTIWQGALLKRKHLYVAGAIAAGALLAWWWKRSKQPPDVAGTLVVGSKSLVISDNVLNPNFALPFSN